MSDQVSALTSVGPSVENFLICADDLMDVVHGASIPIEISKCNEEVKNGKVQTVESDPDLECQIICTSEANPEDSVFSTPEDNCESLRSFEIVLDSVISLHVVMAGISRTVVAKPNDSVQKLKDIIAEEYGCIASELHIICKGRVISNGTLKNCGVQAESKLQVLKRPTSRSWFQLKIHFPISEAKPISLRMHSSSTTLNVKKQLRELLGIPIEDLWLFFSDGHTMNDDVSLRDYSVKNLEDIYCISHSSTQSDVTVSLGDKVPLLSFRLSAEALMKIIVEQHVLREHDGRKTDAKANVSANSSDPHAAASRSVQDSSDAQQSSNQQGTFLGMRKGFLSTNGVVRKRSRQSSSSSTTREASMPSGVSPDSHSSSNIPLERSEAAISSGTGRDSSRYVEAKTASERARKAGIPENLRTGRMCNADVGGGLLKLQKLLSDALSISQVKTEAPEGKNIDVKCQPEKTEEKQQELVTEQRNGRCAACKAKVGLTAIKCRCGGIFCARHRYAEAHACQFDYKAFQRSRYFFMWPIKHSIV